MTKFRSGLEKRVAEALAKDGEWEYEPFSIPYTTQRKYTPDFVQGDIYIEVKGYFRVGDTAKYKAIGEQYQSKGIETCFVFSNPNAPVRKGAKLTLGGWAEKNGWTWTTPADIEEYGFS